MQLFGEEHALLRKTINGIIDKHINPYVDEWEAAGMFPAHEVFKRFGEQGLLFPRRLASGPHKDEVIWGPLLHHRALRVLKNPRYAGAFAYGRSRSRRTPGGGEARVALPREQWHTLILEAHRGYIGWEE